MYLDIKRSCELFSATWNTILKHIGWCIKSLWQGYDRLDNTIAAADEPACICDQTPCGLPHQTTDASVLLAVTLRLFPAPMALDYGVSQVCSRLLCETSIHWCIGIYADGVTILAPSLQALSTLLQVFHDFAITLNSKKNNRTLSALPISSCMEKLYNDRPLWNTWVTLLPTHSKMCMKSNDLFQRTNSVVVNFCAVSRETWNMIYNSNCHIYGSQMWDLTNTGAIEKIHVQWRKGIHILWNLPRSAQLNILHHLIGWPPPDK